METEIKRKDQYILIYDRQDEWYQHQGRDGECYQGHRGKEKEIGTADLGRNGGSIVEIVTTTTEMKATHKVRLSLRQQRMR